MVQVTITYLQLLHYGQLRPSSRPLPPDARFEQAIGISPEFSRFLYLGVGSGLHWGDRLALGREQWADQLGATGSETYVLYRRGAPQGYVELASQATAGGTEVEIFYFGLFPQAIGQGLGGGLLTEGVQRAWTLAERWPELAPVSRVWLHTCSLDGEQALPNYLARGFEVYDTQTEETALADLSNYQWPNAAPSKGPEHH